MRLSTNIKVLLYGAKLRESLLYWFRNAEATSNLLKPRFSFKDLNLFFKFAQSYLLPGRCSYVVFSNEFIGQRIDLNFSHSGGTVVLPAEFPDVHKDHREEIKSTNRNLFQGKPSVAIRRVATLDLNSNLSDFAIARDMPRIRMNANEIVAFIVRWRFVSKNVSPHQVPHY